MSRLDAFLVAVGASERTVDNRTLAYRPVVVFPLHGDVQHKVEGPKRLVALGLAPDVYQARNRDEFIHQVERLGPWPKVVERHQLKSVLVWSGLGLRIGGGVV